jgi:hypothetical protein
MTSSLVLPWMGGPSRFSSPGRMRKFRTEKQMTTVTSTKTGTETMSRTSHSVSIPSACVDDAGGNQSISSPMTTPMTDAISPTTTICAPVRLGARRSAAAVAVSS